MKEIVCWVIAVALAAAVPVGYEDGDDSPPTTQRVLLTRGLPGGGKLVAVESERPEDAGGDPLKQRLISYSYFLEDGKSPPKRLGNTSFDDDHPLGSKEPPRCRLAGVGMTDDGTLVVVQNEANSWYAVDLYPPSFASTDPNQGIAEQARHGRRYLHTIRPGEKEMTVAVSGKLLDHSATIILTNPQTKAEEHWKLGMIENGQAFGWMLVQPGAATRRAAVSVPSTRRL